MKKTFLIIGCCAFLASCGDAKRADGYDKAYDNPTATSEAEGERGIAAEPGVNTGMAEATDEAVASTDNTAAAGQVETQGADYEKGKALIASASDCLACHQIDKKLVGPSYEEVAAKYEFNDKNVDYLASKIIAGGSGVWGQIPMTPHPDLSKTDAAEMAKYVLSLRK